MGLSPHRALHLLHTSCWLERGLSVIPIPNALLEKADVPGRAGAPGADGMGMFIPRSSLGSPQCLSSQAGPAALQGPLPLCGSQTTDPPSLVLNKSLSGSKARTLSTK